MRNIVLLGANVLTAMAFAAVLSTLGFLSCLAKADGSPVTDGQYSVTFTIYDAPDAGNVRWQDINQVTTKEGYFNTIIGEGANKLDPSGVDFTKSLYLGVRGEKDAEMTPPVRLVGYLMLGTICLSPQANGLSQPTLPSRS